MKPRYQRRLPANYQLPTTSYELENWEATWPFPGGTWPLGRYRRLIAKRIPRESVQRFPGFRRFRGAYSKGSLIPRGYEAERQVCAAIDRVGHSCRDESMRSRITANDAKRTVPHVQLTRSSSRG